MQYQDTPLDVLEQMGFDIEVCSHAGAILFGDFPQETQELVTALIDLHVPITEIIGSGGGETKFTQRLRNILAARDWKKHNFTIEKKVDGVFRESTSHEIDHVRRSDKNHVIACEIEWNNKDPFFDRDLENFKRLHAEGAISVGVLITRGKSLQDALYDYVLRYATENNVKNYDDLGVLGYAPTPKQRANVTARVERAVDPLPFPEAWASNFVSNKFGQATTHWGKLQARVQRGVGNPCPLLLIGLPASIVSFDSQKIVQLDEATSDTDGVIIGTLF